jgi:hypothetical protein
MQPCADVSGVEVFVPWVCRTASAAVITAGVSRSGGRWRSRAECSSPRSARLKRCQQKPRRRRSSPLRRWRRYRAWRPYLS